MSGTSALDRLAELDEQVRVATRRLARREQERSASTGRLTAARAPLDRYLADVGAGRRDEDADVERGLLESLRDAHEHVRWEVGPSLRGGGAQELVPVDQRAEALVAGARTALTDAERAVDQHLRYERDAIAGELADRAMAAAAAVNAALPALQAAADADRTVRGGWARLLRALDRPLDLPPDALRGFADDVPVDGVAPAIPDHLRTPSMT